MRCSSVFAIVLVVFLVANSSARRAGRNTKDFTDKLEMLTKYVRDTEARIEGGG